MRKFFSSVKKWIGNYLYFSKATACIRGLVLSHSFVNHAVISVLITYLAEDRDGSEYVNRFQLAAINMLYGGLSIMVCVLVCISNMFGPFKVIAYTNAAYTLGLVLLWMSSYDEVVFFGAGILLAIGEAGRPAALRKFLDDQYLSEADHKIKLPEANRSIEEEEHISTRNEEQDHIATTKEEDDKQKRVEEENQERMETRQTALWNLPWFIGAVAPVAIVKRSWPIQLLLSMILMGVSYLFFWYGVSAYSRNTRNDSNDPAVEDVPFPRDPGLCQAIKSLSASEEAPSWKFWLKPDSRKRYYKEMLVMCFAFITYSLVNATGSTFFFSQIQPDDIWIFQISYIHLYIIESLSSSVISFLWSLLVPKQSKRATLVRIGCGLVCSVLCMVAAWQVEIRRKDETKAGDLWLVPQFSLLGFMRGLAGEGLIHFFADRVDGNGKRKARYYGSYVSELVLGIGTLLTAFSVLGLRKTWSVEGDLDKYYRALVFIGVANLCYYFCVAVYFYTKPPVSCPADGNEQSETPFEDKKHFHHDVSSGDRELETSRDLDCCSFF